MSEPFIGEIKLVGFNFCPQGWTKADGQILPISSNTALFSLYGTMYGGDGETTFALPDLRGRAPIHMGQGAGLQTNRPMGQRLGEETIELNSNANQIPNQPVETCTKQVNVLSYLDDGGDNVANCKNRYEFGPTGRAPCKFAETSVFDLVNDELSDPLECKSIGETTGGSGQSLNNMQPSLVMNYCIATVGIFPSEN